MKIAIACDHGGFELKQFIQNSLKDTHTILDQGTNSNTSVDYPDFASAACQLVLTKQADCAILVCGTGVGMSIAANKHNDIRCALCTNEFESEMTRRHNNANALALGGRVIGQELALRIVNTFLTTEYEGGRHQARLDKIKAIEEAQKK
ncbi:Ribose 5-phosphate isomerase [Spironucleus salmonicida]|uniref:Ribose 5-phosphate isomerase n=1 Tax=Spironucleus salmonicida TaxID=348837 RepID=V6LH31_9EUKA|nr:Ribose 5-phosphate isomerase [Spironucleus salmonicida]|eukprot:EST43865.1 Ribose 5-phosphate isomerase [Spironucleus salmonicida]